MKKARRASDRSDVDTIARRILESAGADESAVRLIGRAFELMKVAEEEIAKAKQRCPRKAKAYDAAFADMAPGFLRNFGDDLYRAHVRELLGRAQRHEPMDPATDAECLAAFSEASLRAPLASEFAHAMSTVFARCYPNAPREAFECGHEAWAGRTEEIIADLRRKLTQPRRAS